MKRSFLLVMIHVSLYSAGVSLAQFDFESDARFSASGTINVTRDAVQPYAGGGSLRVDVTGKSGDWVIATGPVLTAATRTKFATIRRVTVRCAIRVKDMDDYSMQIRVKQSNGSKDGWAWNLSPRRIWETVIELTQAAKFGDWTVMEGTGDIWYDSTELTPMIFVSGKRGTGTVWIDDMSITESFGNNHLFISGQQGNIFFADRGSLTVELSDADRIAGGSITVMDENGNVRRDIPVAKGTLKADIVLDQRGYYAVTAGVRYADGTALESRTSAAVAGNSIADDVRMRSRFGICTVHASTDFAAKSGARWVYGGWGTADFVLTSDGEITPPAGYKPGGNPANVTTIAANFGSFPKWLRPAQAGVDGLYPPTDWALFEKLIEVWAKNTPMPDVVQVFNEPDAHWRGNAEEFVRFHDVIARAIKRVRPEAKIAAPGMYSIRMNDFKKYVDLGILSNMDAVAMHAYVNATPPEGEFIDRVIELNAYLRSIGKGTLPVYFTEFGWNTPPGDWQKPVDEITRARYVTRSLTLLATEKVDGILYFCLRWAAGGGGGYHLMNPDHTPTPGYLSYVNAVRWLSDIEGRAVWWRISPSLNLVIAKKKNAAVGVAWSTDTQRKIDLPAIPLSSESMLGTVLPALKSVSLDVSPSPVFLTFDDASLCSLTLEKPVTAVPGADIFAPANAALPPPFIRQGDRAVIPADAPLGNYLIVTRTPRGFSGQPVSVISPVVLAPAETAGIDSTGAPVIRVSAIAMLNGVSRARFMLKPESGIPLTKNDFESGAAWKGWEFDSSSAAGGARSLKIAVANTTKSSTASSPQFGMTQGRYNAVKVRFVCRAENIAAGDAGLRALAGTPPRWLTFSDTKNISPISIGASWTTNERIILITPELQTAYIYFDFAKTVTGGVLYIDDFSVEGLTGFVHGEASGTVFASLTNGVSNTVSFSLKEYTPGTRFRSTVHLDVKNAAGDYHAETPVDVTFIPCAHISGVPEWSGISVVDFSTRDPHPYPLAANDCSASMRSAYANEGLHLRVLVTDDEHRQTQAASSLWMEDSIQAAFDVDADKEWQPNNVGNGYNGHRIFEYGIALGSDSVPLVYRWRADAPDFKANIIESRVKASVIRKGTATEYDVLFPWETLGLSGAPQAGSSIGFALAVNDKDSKGERKALRLFRGIVESKDPVHFGRLWLK